jgi:hypothetical protein
VVSEGGDATFTLWARRLMLLVVPGMCGVMGNCYATVVEAQATLKTPTGTVLWLQLQMGQAPKSRSLSEFDKHPERLRADFNLAAQAAADKLVQEIVGRRP